MIKNFCPVCATNLETRFWEGKSRFFCPHCQKPVYENPLPATAALVTNKAGEILLVKRNVEPKKGQWCLPGGFVELYETPEAGCLRELEEETGLKAEIDRLVGVYLSENPIYKSVLVMGYTVREVEGEMKAGDDSDEVAYFPWDRMPALAFRSHQAIIDKAFHALGAGRKLKDHLPFGAYVITSGDHLEMARDACRAGARILQYRDKTSGKKEILEKARIIRDITAANRTLFIVNDYIDIALLCGADGVHLGTDDIPVAEARAITPAGFLIGRSTHSLEQALEAEAAGADYIGSGPVFQTPTKESYPPIGIACVQEVRQRVRIPVVAIGGLNLENMAPLHQIGVQNFAMVRAFQGDTAGVVGQINRLCL